MKRKVYWDDEEAEEEESGQEYSTISDDESDDEEPRIKDVLNNLSQAVSRKYASELLHSMATSKDILFWTPRGQLLRNQRIIPVTNISELVDSEEEGTASEEGSGAEESQGSESDSDKEAENSDFENVIQTKASSPCEHCEGSNVYDTAIMKCPKCYWEDNCKICPICEHEIPLDRKHEKNTLRRCYDCGAITHKNVKTSKSTFYPPSNEEDEDN
ncbi:hypothetical protein ACROYT_G013817 [Oculina patagonica]